MLFIIICWLGLIFVTLTLPGALRRRKGVANPVAPVINDVEAESRSRKSDKDYSPLARDRLEVLESWEKCHDNPNLPAPISPSKPHPYFGDESGRDVVD
jgi:hypothetical protein